MGDKLPAGHRAQESNLRTTTASQKNVCVQFFSSPVGNADFTTEGSVRKVGEVRIPCAWEQRLDVSLEFGATEIKATATNVTTNETNDAQIMYT